MLERSLHQHHVVREPWQVRAARGGGAVHHRDLRDAGGRQARLVGEAAPAVHEDLGLVHQVGAAGLDQRYERQLVVAGDLLRAQRLFQAHRGDGAALDGAVARRHDACARPATTADADDGAAALDALLAVVVVHAEPGERAQLEEVAASIEQPRDALARQQLAAFIELVPSSTRTRQSRVPRARGPLRVASPSALHWPGTPRCERRAAR